MDLDRLAVGSTHRGLASDHSGTCSKGRCQEPKQVAGTTELALVYRQVRPHSMLQVLEPVPRSQQVGRSDLAVETEGLACETCPHLVGVRQAVRTAVSLRRHLIQRRLFVALGCFLSWHTPE